MWLIDRVMALFGRSKDDAADGGDEAVDEAEAIAAVRQDIERSGLDAVDRLTDTPGSSDRGYLG
jgi:hypothetical protein